MIVASDLHFDVAAVREVHEVSRDALYPDLVTVGLGVAWPELFFVAAVAAAAVAHGLSPDALHPYLATVLAGAVSPGLLFVSFLL